MRDYHHTKFGLIWIKESKLLRGGGGRIPPPPQVENVLNRPGEIGLSQKYTYSHCYQIHNLEDNIMKCF